MSASLTNLSPNQRINVAILVAALGYFVDVYDLLLFTSIRVESLQSLGLQGEELLSQGILLLNLQMAGMLLGGVLWGVLGDKKGRVEVLFGSILLYSVANIANAFVTTVPQYAVLRFLAGVGLAGEIGAGITLVSELLPKESRGYGTTLIATVGVSGSIAAGFVGNIFHWRNCYIIGAVMGFVLLILRISVNESGLFDRVKSRTDVQRGDLRLLFGTKERFVRYLSCIMVGMPIWYVAGIIAALAPEIGLALGITEPLKASRAVMSYSIGLTVGDLASGLLSQLMQSRKKVLGLFMALTLGTALLLLNSPGASAEYFYGLMIPLGFFIGYWAVFITTAAEQFGTNLRATVATTAPNFVRATVIPLTIAFTALKPHLGVVGAVEAVGVVVTLLSGIALCRMRETFGRDLNFIESDIIIDSTGHLSEETYRNIEGWK